MIGLVFESWLWNLAHVCGLLGECMTLYLVVTYVDII